MAGLLDGFSAYDGDGKQRKFWKCSLLKLV